MCHGGNQTGSSGAPDAYPQIAGCPQITFHKIPQVTD